MEAFLAIVEPNMTLSIFELLVNSWLNKGKQKLTLYMLREAKIDIDIFNISVHRFPGHSKIPSIKCSGHFGGLMFPQ